MLVLIPDRRPQPPGFRLSEPGPHPNLTNSTASPARTSAAVSPADGTVADIAAEAVRGAALLAVLALAVLA